MAAVCIILSVLLGTTACTGKKSTSKDTENLNVIPEVTSLPQSTDTPPDEKDTAENEKNTAEDEIENKEKDIPKQSSPAPDNSSKSAEELFQAANLSGSIMEVSDTEISINAATASTDENGGEILIMDAPSYEDEAGFVHISCGDKTTVQLLTMNRAEEKMISLETVKKSSLTVDSSVLIYGSCQDTTHWTADKIILVVWQ